MYENEIAKEYLRNAFMRGTLDITDSYESTKGFIEIFAGEMEAIIAVSHASYLTDAEQKKLLKIAKVTPDAARHYKAWLERI